MFLRELVKKAETRPKKRNDRGGGGKIRKRLPASPTIMKNCAHPRAQLLIGAVLAGSVDYLALETSINPGLFTCVTDLVSSDL